MPYVPLCTGLTTRHMLHLHLWLMPEKKPTWPVPGLCVATHGKSFTYPLNPTNGVLHTCLALCHGLAPEEDCADE